MKLSAYPRSSMQSRARWLGEMPEHWEVKRLKFIFPRLFSGVSVNSDNSPSLDGSVAILKTSCVYGNRFNPEENKRVVEAEIDRVACPATRDSLVISRMNTPELVGNCGYVDRDYEHLFLPDRLWIARFPNHPDADGKFAWYLVISHALASLTGILATGTSDSMKNLTQEAFLDICVGVPPIPEQQQIAAFLDWKTGQIDALMGKKKELLEKLKEKRLAVITQAVTQGLNPAAPMRDSGIPWLGQVPQHWEVPALKFRYNVELGKMLDEKRITGEHSIPYLRNVDVQWDQINYEDLPVMDIAPDEYSRYTIREGDVLACEGGEVGRSAVAREQPSMIGFQKAIHRLRADSDDELPTFIYYTLLWAVSTGVFSAEGSSTIAHLTADQLRRYRFPQPPRCEQEAIVAYLEDKVGQMNSLAAKVESAIARLTEYRTALITAATTGKIDVRKVKIPQPGS